MKVHITQLWRTFILPTTGHLHANYINQFYSEIAMKISVSLLSSYLYCSRKLFLEKVLLLKEPPKESLVLGSIRHETYDNINKAEELIVTSIAKKTPLAGLEVMYRQKYLQILRQAIANNRQRLEDVNLSMLDAYRRSSAFIRVESETLRLKGIIDQVHVYNGEYVPFELKTGRAPNDGVWPSHRVQLAAYSLLLQEHFKKPIKEGFVVYLDTKEKRHIAVNPYMKEEVTQIVNDILALLESRELPDFCHNENKCRKCGLKSTCYNEEEVSNLLKVRIS